MSDSFITQCPHCHTSFRVNQAQLGAANGAVRCGSCLKVFNALQHMQRPAGQAPAPIPAPVPVPAPERVAQPAVSAPPQPAPQPPAPRPVAPATPVSPPVGATLGWPLAPHSARPAADSNAAEPAPAPAPAPAPDATTSIPTKLVDETLWIHDDLDLDSLNLDEELAKLDEFELSQEFRELKAAPKPADALLGAQHKPRDPHDERWAEALLEDERHAPGARQEPSLGPPEAEPEELPEAPQPIEPEPVVTSESEPEEDDEPLPALSARRDDDEIAEPLDEDDEGREPTIEANDEPDEDEKPHVVQSIRNEPALRDESLRELSDEPLQLDWQKPKGRWGRRLLWTLLILLAAGGLGAQYVVYHFDELAREDAYRPWFAEFCPQIGCSLPSKVDVEQIRSSNLVVRSHPDFSGALVVDAIIYNRASFSQPFPLLELRFADINGQLLASRSFKPSEYLGGELAGQTEMPPQTPIHISLDILDPGPKAVNYSLSFHSPE
ncbi:DUF3426 domain-containing protein [Pseudomonas knackmussii]|uniref:DUF3426 domain-containing protein n=1 Tax=Pseudomonas knackmussii TaxID=65741 RepID=UPI0013621684|nr:DUF3426 domain-containing protein [Pseudomonas knackmussii]